MYNRILLPTDTSPGVEEAIEHAIDAADRYDAELHLLFVVDEDVYSAYSGDEYVHEQEGLESALEQAGREALEQLRERAEAEGVDVTTEVRHGIPHEKILEYAEDADIDLTVVGSKHRPGEYRRLLGSVAERIARMSKRPVSIVKTEVEQEE